MPSSEIKNISQAELISLRIQAGFVTQDDAALLMGCKPSSIRKLFPIKKRIPGSTIGIFYLDDLKAHLCQNKALDIEEDFFDSFDP